MNQWRRTIRQNDDLNNISQVALLLVYESYIERTDLLLQMVFFESPVSSVLKVQIIIIWVGRIIRYSVYKRGKRRTLSHFDQFKLYASCSVNAHSMWQPQMNANPSILKRLHGMLASWLPLKPKGVIPLPYFGKNAL